MSKTNVTSKSEIKKLQDKARTMGKNVREERCKAMRRVADQAAVELKDRSPEEKSRRINQQDSTPMGNPGTLPPGAGQTKIVRDHLDGVGSSSFVIRVGPMQVRIRDRGSLTTSEISKLLPSSMFERTELIIKGKGWKSPQKVTISGYQNLPAWCRRTDKGFQLWHQTVFVQDMQILDKVVLAPVSEVVKANVAIQFREAVRAGLKAV